MKSFCNSRSSLLLAAVALGASTARAELIDAGHGRIFDRDLNLYWSQDANLFATQAGSYAGGPEAFVAAVMDVVGGVVNDTPNVFDNGGPGVYNLSPSDFNAFTGTMSWWGAQAWVGYLNHIGYGGNTGWRLPATPVPAQVVDFNVTGSELGHLYYTELGGAALQSVTVVHNDQYSLFGNVQTNPYFSGTEASANPATAWCLDFNISKQVNFKKFNSLNVLPLHPGHQGREVETFQADFPAILRESRGPAAIDAPGEAVGAGTIVERVRNGKPVFQFELTLRDRLPNRRAAVGAEVVATFVGADPSVSPAADVQCRLELSRFAVNRKRVHNFAKYSVKLVGTTGEEGGVALQPRRGDCRSVDSSGTVGESSRMPVLGAPQDATEGLVKAVEIRVAYRSGKKVPEPDVGLTIGGIWAP